MEHLAGPPSFLQTGLVQVLLYSSLAARLIAPRPLLHQSESFIVCFGINSSPLSFILYYVPIDHNERAGLSFSHYNSNNGTWVATPPWLRAFGYSSQVLTHLPIHSIGPSTISCPVKLPVKLACGEAWFLLRFKGRTDGRCAASDSTPSRAAAPKVQTLNLWMVAHLSLALPGSLGYVKRRGSGCWCWLPSNVP